MGEGNFWPQQNPHSLTDHKKFVASDYVGDPYGCAKFGANPSTGGRGVFYANVWNITKILFVPFLFHDGSNDVDLCKNVSFGGFVDIAAHFGGDTRLT